MPDGYVPRVSYVVAAHRSQPSAW